jgi:hypothetical protein
VILATELFLRGRSYNEIVAALNASPHHAPRADRWGYATVRKMMRNDTYAGLLSWGGFEAADPSSRFPALWDEKTYQAVLRERARRSGGTYRKPTGSPFIDVAFCGRCGGRMAIARKEYATYLRCSNHSERLRGGHTCHHNAIKVDRVWEALAAFLEGILDVGDVISRVEEGDARGVLRDRLDEIGRQVEATEGKRRRLALAYAASAMEMAVYREADDELLADLDALEGQRADIEQQLAHLVPPDVRWQAIQNVQALLAAAFEGSESHEIAAALQSAGLRIEIEEAEVVAISLE